MHRNGATHWREASGREKKFNILEYPQISEASLPECHLQVSCQLVQQSCCSRAQSTPAEAGQLTKEAWHGASHHSHPHLLPRAAAATHYASWPVAGRPRPSRRRQHWLAVRACSSGREKHCRRPPWSCQHQQNVMQKDTAAPGGCWALQGRQGKGL